MVTHVNNIGEEFLLLEKYVNLNFTGFHKILKKHDRRLPNQCRGFYLNRLHNQSWVRGDYSDVLVSISRIFSKIRGDSRNGRSDTDDNLHNGNGVDNLKHKVP